MTSAILRKKSFFHFLEPHSFLRNLDHYEKSWLWRDSIVPIGCTRAGKTSDTRPSFWERIFWIVKNKKLGLKIHSRIGKSMKKLIPNTIMKTTTLMIFWCLYIWWPQNCFIYSTHGLGNIQFFHHGGPYHIW